MKRYPAHVTARVPRPPSCAPRRSPRRRTSAARPPAPRSRGRTSPSSGRRHGGPRLAVRRRRTPATRRRIATLASPRTEVLIERAQKPSPPRPTAFGACRRIVRSQMCSQQILRASCGRSPANASTEMSVASGGPRRRACARDGRCRRPNLGASGHWHLSHEPRRFVRDAPGLGGRLQDHAQEDEALPSRLGPDIGGDEISLKGRRLQA
jgi:hypothetical protein